MYFDIVYIFIGFILLTISGNFLVKGAVSIARSFKVSPLVIGVTVVSMGTSAPELIVSVQAALVGSSSISLGNVIGSNISNIALVLGLTAIIFPISVVKSGIKRDWLVMIFATLLLILFIYTNNTLEKWEGLLFVVILTGYVVLSILESRKMETNNLDSQSIKTEFWFNKQHLVNFFKKGQPPLPVLLSIIAVIVASVGLYYGADLLIKGSVDIARYFEISERIIAVTVVALGTSIPELATSITAAFKKEMEISIGNIIGSNIFNILGILGVASIIREIHIEDFGLFNDLIWQFGLSFLLVLLIIPVVKSSALKKFKSFFTFFAAGDIKGGIITRKEGFLLVFIYFAYLFWVFVL